MTDTISRGTELDRDQVVHNSVYLDPKIFEAEQERLFGRAWNLVGHECELPNPGDYFTRDLAGSPMIITRDHDGDLRALYNTCRHRGSLVASQERGHCKTLLCPYHNWNYALDGRLLGVPGIESFEGTGFTKEDYGLVMARVESAHGLIFVCQGEAAPSLAEYLGPQLIEWLSRPFGMADLELYEIRRAECTMNWKLAPENARDGYHVPNLHPFLKKASQPKPYHMYGPHALQELSPRPEAISAELWQGMQNHALPGMGPLDGYVAVIFPDSWVLVRSNFIRVQTHTVVAPDRTIVENRIIGLKGDSEEVRKIRLNSYQSWVGDVFELQDLPALLLQQRGIATHKVPLSIIARAAGTGGGDAEPLGQVNRGDDERLRQFWHFWREYMGLRQNAPWGNSDG